VRLYSSAIRSELMLASELEEIGIAGSGEASSLAHELRALILEEASRPVAEAQRPKEEH
jgi:hypothetical protein